MKNSFFILLILIPVFLFAQQAIPLKQKIGQMILMGLPDNKMDTTSTFYKEVKEGIIGGITMYERHLTAINAAENLKQLISFYQNISTVPLFVAITQEGGQVNRLKPKYGFPPMPSAEYLGKIDNMDSTKFYADNIAYTLSRLGINVNFAPVLDILVPDNPVLGSRERCFSDDNAIIVKQAEQVILSHNYFNVITVVKHFPGHGSSTEDSHLGLTDVSRTWKKSELVPYQNLIKKGLVKAVMTAHIVNTNLDDSKLPATLSKKIITGILRKKLKFNGVIFSDDMNMKAISAEYELKEAIEKTINAGVDVLLFSGSEYGDRKVTGAVIAGTILQLVKEENISEKRINESYERIMKMKGDSFKK